MRIIFGCTCHRHNSAPISIYMAQTKKKLKKKIEYNESKANFQSINENGENNKKKERKTNKKRKTD